MECLHCGDCCLRMSPLSLEPCSQLIQDDDFYFCRSYNKRPEQCRKHSFPSRFCPIGIEKLNLQDTHQIALRIDKGYEKTKQLTTHGGA